MSDEKYIQILVDNPELPRHPQFLSDEFPDSRDFKQEDKIVVEYESESKEVVMVEDIQQIQLVFESEVKADV